jgi:hypothetical protein
MTFATFDFTAVPKSMGLKEFLNEEPANHAIPVVTKTRATLTHILGQMKAGNL